MTDEEWAAQQQWLQRGRPEKGQKQDAAPASDPAAKPLAGAAVPSNDPLNLVWSGIKGATKEMFDPSDTPSTFAPNPNPSALAQWASSEDKEHPWAEKAGRTVADLAPLAMIPGLTPISAAAGKLAPYAPRAASWLDRLAQAAWKGSVGGASQAKADPATAARVGAEGGVGTQAFRMALSSIPHRNWFVGGLGAGLPSLAAFLWSQSKGRGVEPWWMYRLMQEAVPALAASSALVAPPGVAGAVTERAAQATGYDTGNQPPQGP